MKSTVSGLRCFITQYLGVNFRIMLKFYLKLYLRKILKNKTTSFITIGGFGLSLAVTLLFASYILEEISVNSSFENVDNIYQVIEGENNAAIEQIDNTLFGDIPGIKRSSYYSNFDISATIENKSIRAKVIMCNTEFFKIFNIESTNGNFGNIFKDKNNVVITESFAEKVFGKINPIGKAITLEHNDEYFVSAVVKDFPSRSSITAEIFCHADSRFIYEAGGYDGITIYLSRLFVELQSNMDISVLENAVSERLVSLRKQPYNTNKYKLAAFKDSYFNSQIERDHLAHANIDLIMLIAAVTLVVLILSAFNYINITLAQNLDRVKEFGIKKINGALETNIFFQIIFETSLNLFLSILLSFILFEFLTPLFITLLGREVTYQIVLSNSGYLSLSILGIATLILLLGVYPAIKAVKKQTVVLLKQKFDSRENNRTRNVLSIIQFTITAILITCLIVVSQQSDYLRTKNLGYNKEELLKLDIHYRVGERAFTLKNKLLQHPSIISVSNSFGVPGSILSWFANGKIESHVMNSDNDFLETFEIDLLEGRFFSPSEKNVCVVNEKLLKENNVEDWKSIDISGHKIIGVVKNFEYKSLHSQSGSLTIYPADNNITNLTIRINSENIHATINYIKEVWTEIVPEFHLQYSFYDEWLDQQYKAEERNAEIIKIFTLISIVIALLGLFAATELTLRKRMKEISIRKVCGANIKDIFLLQNKRIFLFNIISVVVAAPISYYFLTDWLNNYPHRIEIGIEVFLFSGTTILILSFLTTCIKMFNAARVNPIELLKEE